MKKLFAASAVLLLCTFVINLSAVAGPQNVLDSRVVTGQKVALSSANGTFQLDFSDAGANFIDCVASASGTLCINNGDSIVDLSNYQNPLFTCTDLGFQAKKSNQTVGNCSAILVADDVIYVGGIRNRNGSALVKVQQKNGAPCPAGYAQVGNKDYCSALLAIDRPPINDLDRLSDNELLVTENRNSINRYTGLGPGTTSISIFADSKTLALAKGTPKEDVQHITLFAYPTNQTAVIVATSFGRLLILGPTGSLLRSQSLSTLGLPALAGCPSVAASYDLTQDTVRVGPLYLSVSNACYVHALVPAPGFPTSAGFMLLSQTSSEATVVGSTKYNPLTVDVYEGQNINFSQCSGPCNVGTATTLSNFTPLPGTATSGTLWQITGIPHCAWIPETCVNQLDPPPPAGPTPQARLCAAGVLRPVGPFSDTSLTCANAPPGLLVFNVTPLLPANFKAEFNLPGGFPDLLMPPDFQAQSVNEYLFDALLFNAGDAQSSETPEIVVDEPPPSYGCPESGPVSPLQSSIVLRMRERALTGGTCNSSGTSCTLNANKGSMITYDCFNPTIQKGCCSLYPLNVMLALNPPAKAAANLWFVDSKLLGNGIDDTAAAKFVDSHFEDMKLFQWAACHNVDNDPNGLAPLDQTTCDQLTHIYDLAKEKWITALTNSAAQNNNCSQASRNYQAFVSQVENLVNAALSYEGNFPACNDGIDNDGDGFIDTADGGCAAPLARDPAGRVQALAAHGAVLPYVVNEMLIPTIPATCPTGFLEDSTYWIFN